MHTTTPTYPLVTVPVGQLPLRCIYTLSPVVAGQLVALSPLGYISLVVVAHKINQVQQLTTERAYLVAVFRAYEQRQGWLPQATPVLTRLAEDLLTTLLLTIPLGQTRYLHQLLQANDLSPWLTALTALPANPN